MARNWSALEHELAAVQDFLRQPIAARLSELPAGYGDEQIWLDHGVRVFDRAVSRVHSGVNEGIGPAVLAQPIDQVLLKRGCDELREGVGELKGVVVMGRALEQSGPHGSEIGHCLRQAAEHCLSRLEVWLTELRELLADPAAALRARGLPTSGEVELDLTLSFGPSPALDRLRAMVSAMDEPAQKKPPSPTWGFVKLVMAGLVLLLAFQFVFR